MVPVTFLLKSDLRNGATAEKVSRLAAGLGFEITGVGEATVAATIGTEAFKRIFQTDAKIITSERPGLLDYGSGGGYEVSGILEVPEPLKEYVDAVSVEPPMTRF